ncbi:glutamine--scyllo-inositol aminotransferase [Pseudidiomarina tainanensis]|uniref:Glutamine--scyllo-inositol aminotransferase n=1 Tax=Pseudidiomarina tainanensis TaxID=502365 RepID=A0ACD2HJ92_9GAMM|nr:DegT/DnrJ/EryC1/StrS family aminotransferase [Pseudidiomarina tainanensis]RZQ56287.1 glutamine--scyllo-inositol aminotransferase [Pseudidiomarina tainanensis]
MIKLSTPNIGEDAIDAMNQVIRSGQLVHGEECLAFEKELATYLNVNHALVCSNGTAALHLALLTLEIGPGDAVIVPDFTYPATANVVAVCGARVVVVDVDRENYCIDIKKLRDTVRNWQGPEKLKAIMPVHEFGFPADMSAIVELANEHSLAVIEDAACAIGASRDGRKMGTIGTIGCFSFHPRKTLTTGEGGLVVTNNAELADKLRRFRNHGMERTDKGMKFFYPGLNYRLTNFQATLGRHQLQQLENWLKRRVTLARDYIELLQPLVVEGKIRLPETNSGHSWQTFMIVLDRRYNRDEIITLLRAQGVESSLGAQSLTTLNIYPTVDNSQVTTLVGHELFTQGLALPFCEIYDRNTAIKVVQALSDSLN